MEILAIIPARGGSKGIPRKNIRNFSGYPLIAWSIAAAQQSRLVTRVIVSTDDEEIAAVARAWGAETPFLRPSEFAQDKTTDLPVFEHALKWLAAHENYHPEVVVQLRPTSPIRPRNCVDGAVQALLDHPKADCVRGVVPAGQNPHKMWRLPNGENGPMKNLLDVPGIDEPYNAPRQILPPIYWQTGHIDAIRPRAILQKGSMSGDVLHPFVLDPAYTVDLDNLGDWMRAEWLAQWGGLDYVRPGKTRRPMPAKVEMLVLDFDGVISDNRVWTDENGRESVASNRSDSYGLMLLRQAGVQAYVISKETNPVVAARCKKMKVDCLQSVDDKAAALQTLLAQKGINPAQTVFLGNDINDLPCAPLVGCFAAVADSHPQVLREADLLLSQKGGHGAVRELCDMILNQNNKETTQ